MEIFSISSKEQVVLGMVCQTKNFNYDTRTNKFTYYDERGKEHDTGIGYEKGKIGKNWNPFKSNGRKTNVTPHDAKMMRLRLQQWQNDNAPSITRGYRANDAERRWRSEYDASERERRRREQEELQRLGQPKGYNQFDHFSQYFGSNPLSR